MRALNLVTTSFVILMIVLISGCSGKDSPVIPGDETRAAENFNPSWSLFSGAYEYDEIDLAPVLWGYEPGAIMGPIGDPALINGKHWCIAVTVEHAENEDCIRYSVLDDVDSAYGGPAVSTGILFSGGDEFEICSSKVSAMYIDYGLGLAFIEFDVAFMLKWKDISPEADGRDIGVVHGRWLSADFPNGPMVSSAEAEIKGNGPAWGDWSPDIAHSYRNGDLHLVYTTWVDFLEFDKAKLVYERRRRTDGNWLGPYHMTDPFVSHQQWIPRIAVGDGGFPIDYVVAVAYTECSNSPSPIPYQLGAVYWAAWQDDPQETAVFYHLPYDSSQPAGLPRIAITPDNANTHFTSVAFTQKLADGNYQAIEVNNIRNAGTYYEYFWPIERDDNPWGIFPSVTCHNVSGNPIASICYYEMEDVNDWRVSYARFNPTVIHPIPSWQDMAGTGADVLGILEPIDYGSYLYIDTFRGSDIVAIDSPPFSQAFWVGWCDYIDSDATTVYAAFGDTS